MREPRQEDYFYYENGEKIWDGCAYHEDLADFDKYLGKTQEKIYSEEDMDNYAEYCTSHVLTSQIGHPYLSAKEWFKK